MKLEIAHFGSLVSLVNHFDSERRFPCFVGTIFQNIKLPLRKWFYADVPYRVSQEGHLLPSVEPGPWRQ